MKVETEADNKNDEDSNDKNDGDGDSTMDVFGTARAYRPPFLDFPILYHHAHSFYVIDNALPKLHGATGPYGADPGHLDKTTFQKNHSEIS